MKTINVYGMAEVAEASYSDLEGAVAANDIVAALLSEQVSPTQASEFVNHWKVVHHQPDDPISGFSATLFESLDNPGGFTLAIRGTAGLVDINADVGDIVHDGLAVKQIIDLYNYLKRMDFYIL